MGSAGLLPRPPTGSWNHVEKVALRHHDVHLSPSARGLDGLRLAHISDLHFSKWSAIVESAQRRLLELDYDLLAVTGDFTDWPRNWRRAVELMKRFFGPLAGKGDIYATLGNHDHEAIAEAQGLPVRFLRDNSIVLERTAAHARLAGVEQVRKRGGNVHKALGVDDNLPTVLLAHYPSTVYRLPPGRVHLQLSGHTHAGQWRLPLVGCLWGNDWIHPRHAWGLHHIRQTPLHVSAGIGASLPIPIRVNCPPEVTLLTLHANTPSISERPVEASARRDQR